MYQTMTNGLLKQKKTNKQVCFSWIVNTSYSLYHINTFIQIIKLGFENIKDSCAVKNEHYWTKVSKKNKWKSFRTKIILKWILNCDKTIIKTVKMLLTNKSTWSYMRAIHTCRWYVKNWFKNFLMWRSYSAGILLRQGWSCSKRST